MRETSFIKQNKDKWKEFEEILKRQQKDPDKLNKLFVQITDDLSYSRTFYPNRSVRVYLNNLAQQIFHNLYKNKRSKRERLIRFWTDELPQLVYESRRAFFLALGMFVLSFFIGVLSSAMDPEFPRIILGDSYVDMTIANIESGDPMKVYKQKGAFSMAMGITLNNVYVAFLTFILGAFFAVGSAAILIKNAIMVGAFQYFFYEKGVFLESFLTIWTHGTLEISAIIIAGAAGLTMGKGLIFPGTYSRLQAFQVSARRGLKIMLGITPVLLLAGFIEGYLTRYTETPDIVSGAFILLCLGFVLFYFVWYPWTKSRKGFSSGIREAHIPPNAHQRIDFSVVKSAGEIFSDIFVFYKQRSKFIFLLSLSLAAVFCALSYSLAQTETYGQLFAFSNNFLGSLDHLYQFFFHPDIPLMPFFNLLLYAAFVLVVFQYFIRYEEGTHYIPATGWMLFFSYLQLLPLVYTMQYILGLKSIIAFIAALSFFPLILLSMYIMLKERRGLLLSVLRSLELVSGYSPRAFSLYFLLLAIGILFLSLADTTLVYLYVEFISINFSLEEEGNRLIVNILLSLSSVTIICLIFVLFLTGGALLYYTLREIKEAPSLLEKIEALGGNHQIRGLKKEG